jgi:hypothetical protein
VKGNRVADNRSSWVEAPPRVDLRIDGDDGMLLLSFVSFVWGVGICSAAAGIVPFRFALRRELRAGPLGQC